MISKNELKDLVDRSYRIECTSCSFIVHLTKEEYRDPKSSGRIMMEAIREHKDPKYKDCDFGKLYFNSL